MLKAIALGTLAQSALLLSGLLVYWIRLPTEVRRHPRGFGAGALIEAVAFDLVAEAENLDSLQFALWMLVARDLRSSETPSSTTFRRRRGDGIVVGSWLMAFLSPRSSGSRSRPGFRSASVSSPRSSSPTSRRRSRPPPIWRRRAGRWADRGHVGARLGRLWCRIRPRIPACRLVLPASPGIDGGARRRRPSRDADQLADALRVRARRAARRRRHRPRLLHPADVLMADMPELEDRRERRRRRPRRLIGAFYSPNSYGLVLATHPAHLRCSRSPSRKGPGHLHRRRGADRHDLGFLLGFRGSPRFRCSRRARHDLCVVAIANPSSPTRSPQTGSCLWSSAPCSTSPRYSASSVTW